MKNRTMNRREFLLAAGSGIVVLPLAAALTGCGGGGGSTPATPAGDFTITSIGGTHTHDITVKAADLAAGVQVVYTSTNTGGHTHTVTLTPAEITDINGGKLDNINSSLDAGHSHEFPVKKP